MKKKVSFEESIEKLEKIVSEMENEEIPLDLALEKYKDAVSLISMCHKSLDDAKLKIETINMENTDNSAVKAEE